jgi:hypothetical protein
MSRIDGLRRVVMAVRSARRMPKRRPPPRKPPPGSEPQPAIPPKGPLPLEGGAAATVDE